MLDVVTYMETEKGTRVVLAVEMIEEYQRN